MGILDGLGNLGLGNLQKMQVYDEKEKKKQEEEEKKKQEEEAKKKAEPKKPFNEASILLNQKEKCPVCEQTFERKRVRTNACRANGSDTDLRQKYQPADQYKYNAVVCPYCGYAALARFWKDPLMDSQKKAIREKISINFQGIDTKEEFYTYDSAILRYKLALGNAMVKDAKPSEKAFICWQLAWLCRGKAESLDASAADYQSQVQALKKEELELLTNAYAGFSAAYSTEGFPMCGMDEATLSYVLGELARRVGKFDEAARYISKVLTTRGVNEKLKDRARDIKELLPKNA